MTIWHNPAITVEMINQHGQDTMSAHMGVVFTTLGPDFLSATMPVDPRSQQYMGILHGGASAFLAENVASVGANLVVDPQTHYCVGLEINANHLRPVRHGLVTATAQPIHRGRSTQVWEVRIEDDRHRLCCISRMTLSVQRRSDDASPTGISDKVD